MKSIQNILQTDGIEFIDSLMNDYLTVYEKLNASTLSFRRIGNELKFYKGRDNEEITSLNETLYSYFKDGMEYIRRVSLVFYMEFPEGWLFRLQWFNPNSTGLVEYQNQPKNNFVLSCIDTGNSIIEDLNVLKKWADRLQVDISEPVFSGFLSEFQKDKLIDYVEGRCECDVPFSQYIISILNPSVSHSAFSDTFNTLIDSFIFKFYKAGSKKCVSMKLVDPYMDKMLKQNKNKFGDNSGTENEIILANFVAWLQTVDMKDIDIDGDTNDERYFDLLCKLFNMYIEKEQKLFKDMKSDINESYKVNIDNIKNDDTVKLLKENPHLSTAFQVIVGSFMNTKNAESNPSSIMDDTLRDMFNKEVSSIKRLTNNKDEQVKSFAELMKSSMENDSSEKDAKDEKVMSFSELMDKIGRDTDENEENESSEDKQEKHVEHETLKDEPESETDKEEKDESEDEEESEKTDKVSDERKEGTDNRKSNTDAKDAEETEESDNDKKDEKEDVKSDKEKKESYDEKSEEDKDEKSEEDEEKQEESDKENESEDEEKSDKESDKEDKEKEESEDKVESEKEEKDDISSDADKKDNEEKQDKGDEGNENLDDQKVIDKDEPEKTKPEPKASKEKPETESEPEPVKKQEKPEKKKPGQNDDGSMSL